MLKKLGKQLKQSRDHKALSLESAAAPAKISAAYLHKLEHGQVNNPSPRVLARIAVALDVAYLDLMELAGYLDEEQRAQAQARQPQQPHPLASQQLTPEEWKAVAAFIQNLLAQRETAPPSGAD